MKILTANRDILTIIFGLLIPILAIFWNPFYFKYFILLICVILTVFIAISIYAWRNTERDEVFYKKQAFKYMGITCTLILILFIEVYTENSSAKKLIEKIRPYQVNKK